LLQPFVVGASHSGSLRTATSAISPALSFEITIISHSKSNIGGLTGWLIVRKSELSWKDIANQIINHTPKMKRIILSLLTVASVLLTTSNGRAATIAAPDSVSGMTAIAKMTAPKAETLVVVFGGSTYTDNLGEYGTYTYAKTDASHCVLVMTQQSPGSNYGDVNTLDLAFKNNYSGGISGQVAFAGGGSNSLKGSFTFDITAPTLMVTAPRPNAKVTNGTFTVTGTARDNVAVSNVWWQVNSNGWQLASQVNNTWSNWTATATLVPGPNILQAYAVDTSGNVSKISTVKLTYILTSPLTVQINGSGAVSPNDNGKFLNIGASYTLRAVPARGFGFYYWSGTNVTMSSNATLKFTMSSNLTIIANFKDTAKPVATTTYPTANLKWGGTNITVTGKASDNVGVVGVWVQMNGGGWMAVNSANGYTNWSVADLPVVIGPNVVQTYAVDTAGNVSLTNTVKFTGVSPSSSGFAPASLSGYAATIKISGKSQTIAMTWGDDTWAQTGTGNDTNADDYCAGTYTYIQTGPNTAVMTNTDIGMMSALGTTNVTTIYLTFTKTTAGTCTWTNGNDSGTATLTFSQVKDLVPASLAGKTLTARGSVIIFAADGTYINPASANNGEVPDYGTYAFTQYSPTVAILQLNSNDPMDNYYGAVAYLETTFTSSSNINIAQSWYQNPSFGAYPDDWGQATGTIK
jgi:hypothetical protein